MVVPVLAARPGYGVKVAPGAARVLLLRYGRELAASLVHAAALQLLCFVSQASFEPPTEP